MSIRTETYPQSLPDRRVSRAATTRHKNQLIFDLVHGIAGLQDEVIDEARSLRMDLSQPRAVILVDATDYVLGPAVSNRTADRIEGARARSREVIASIVAFFMLPHEAICADLGDGMIVVLKASNSRNLGGWVDEPLANGPATPSWANLGALKRAASDLLQRLLTQTGESVSIGIGRYHPGTAGLAGSFTDARTALSLGRRLYGPNRVHCLDDLGIAAFVGLDDERTKSELAHHLLSPLDHEPLLVKTLDAFFGADCSPALAARRLRIHRNTLSYRLAKVASLTGLDPRRFDEAVQIRIALVVRGLGRQSQTHLMLPPTADEAGLGAPE